MLDHPIAKAVLERIAPSGDGLVGGAEADLVAQLEALELNELEAAIETLVALVFCLIAERLEAAADGVWRVIDATRPRMLAANVEQIARRSRAATDRGRRFDTFQGPRQLAPYSPSSDAAKAERSGAFLSRMPLVIR
jgi:hypothetical protein